MSEGASTLDVYAGRASYALAKGDGVAWLDAQPDGSLDAIISDFPYAEIDRDYGRMTEPEWHAFAQAMVRTGLRKLAPRGSMLVIIQPNSEYVGRMRAWAFQFMAWAAGELPRETDGRIGMVQDAYWWNIATAPTIHAQREVGLLRCSLKDTVWIGPADCYRNQDAVLWQESHRNAVARTGSRVLHKRPSGLNMRDGRCASAAEERGGVTPFNVLPIANTNSTDSAGADGHGAGTPYELAAWWTRYLVPPGGVTADPCMGDGTMGRAAVQQGRRFVGCELMQEHYERAIKNMARCDLDTESPIASPSAGDDAGPLFARLTRPGT